MLPNLGRGDDDHPDGYAGVDFFTKLVTAVAEQPLYLDGRSLPEKLSFKDWLTYLGYLRGSDYWRNYRPNPELRGSSAVNCAIQVGSGSFN